MILNLLINNQRAIGIETSEQITLCYLLDSFFCGLSVRENGLSFSFWLVGV
jgi:hypothetical protein